MTRTLRRRLAELAYQLDPRPRRAIRRRVRDLLNRQQPTRAAAVRWARRLRHLAAHPPAWLLTAAALTAGALVGAALVAAAVAYAVLDPEGFRNASLLLVLAAAAFGGCWLGHNGVLFAYQVARSTRGGKHAAR